MLHVENTIIPKEVDNREVDVMRALQSYDKYTSRSVATITVVETYAARQHEEGQLLQQGEHQGKSFCILHPEEHVYGIIDTHRHYITDGTEVGSLFYRFHLRLPETPSS